MITFFHIFFNSLFTNNPIIRRRMTWATNGVAKYSRRDEILRPLCSLKIHYQVQTRPPLDRTLRQMDAFHSPPLFLSDPLKYYPPFKRKPSKRSLPTNIFSTFYDISNAFYIRHPIIGRNIWFESLLDHWVFWWYFSLFARSFRFYQMSFWLMEIWELG